MSRKKTREEFIEEMKIVNPDIEIIGEYKNSRTGISCRCKVCGYGKDGDWKPTPSNLLQGKGCQRCAGNERIDTEIFKQKLYEVNPDIEVMGEYINARTNIKCKCKICGYGEDGDWEPQPYHLLHGEAGCHRCSNRERYTTETFKEKLKIVNPNIEVLGKYTKSDIGILCKCKICGYGEDSDWKPTPNQLLSEHGCPKCASHLQTSWLQEELTKHFSQNYTVLSRDKSLIGMELDIVIPELNIAIEPGSWYWHFENENKLSNDYMKQQLCKEKGYTCITIYDDCDFPDVIWYPALVYNIDVGQNRKMLSQVIQDIEDVIKERNVKDDL